MLKRYVKQNITVLLRNMLVTGIVATIPTTLFAAFFENGVYSELVLRTSMESFLTVLPPNL